MGPVRKDLLLPFFEQLRRRPPFLPCAPCVIIGLIDCVCPALFLPGSHSLIGLIGGSGGSVRFESAWVHDDVYQIRAQCFARVVVDAWG